MEQGEPREKEKTLVHRFWAFSNDSDRAGCGKTGEAWGTVEDPVSLVH